MPRQDVPYGGGICSLKERIAEIWDKLGEKVDKITGDSTKRAYTHTGSVQDDTPVVNGTDANSIGLRDANGRMQAADPASGATDKTLVTANWVCQTGGTNNLIHSTGEEIIVSKKIFRARPNIGCIDMPAITPGQTWRSLIAAAYPRNFYFLIINPRNSCICIDYVKIPESTMAFSLQRVNIFGTNSLNKYSIRKNSDGKYYLCINSSYHQGLTIYLLSYDDTYGNIGYEPLESDDASSWEVVSE